MSPDAVSAGGASPVGVTAGGASPVGVDTTLATEAGGSAVETPGIGADVADESGGAVADDPKGHPVRLGAPLVAIPRMSWLNMAVM